MNRNFLAMVTTVLVIPSFVLLLYCVFSENMPAESLLPASPAWGAERESIAGRADSENSEKPLQTQKLPDTEGKGASERVAWEVGSMRLLLDADGQPAALQTAILTYTIPPVSGDDRSAVSSEYAGLRVDLIAAVHIGDRRYYQVLNSLFRQYDSVLYELVAKKGSRPPKPVKGQKRQPSSLLSAVQLMFGEILGLQFQLEEIDYTPSNFVHADLSPEQFNAAMQERNDGMARMLGRMLGYQLAAGPGKSSDAELFAALLSSDPQQRLRRFFAGSMADADRLTDILDAGGENGSAIITARNAAAIEVLRERMEAGDHRIAVFYGGAHSPDFEKRFAEEFGLAHTATHWLTAWSL